MANRTDQTKDSTSIVIDGFENGIAASPYKGIANIRNLSIAYYPDVAYVNYRRQSSTVGDGNFYAGTHSINVSNNTGWIFTASGTQSIGNPIQKAVSPSGLIYILDSNGEVFKQTSVGSTTFNIIENGGGRFANGTGGLAWWNNYIVVFGSGVIEFCGDGTGDAGITSANWNLNSGTGFGANGFTFTTNFASNPTRLTLSNPITPRLQVGDTVQVSTTGTLPAGLLANTTYIVASTFNGITLSTSFANANELATGPITSTSTSATLANNWTGTTGTYSMVFSDHSFKAVTLTNGANTITWTGGLVNTVTANLIVSITLTSDGTGVQTITDVSDVLPLGNDTNVILYTVGTLPYTTLTFNPGDGVTFGSYTNTVGVTVTGVWLGATGLYNLVMSNGQKIPANFTFGSSSVNLLSSLSYSTLPTPATIQLLDPTVTFYRPYVSKVDGSLMFCNGQFIGRIATNADPNLNFNPSLPSSYVVSFGVTSIPEQYLDTVTDMTDLQSTLVVVGQKDVYTWDYISASTSSPSPVGEKITGIINLLNNIYVFAGTKGNIYVTNGYSSQFFFKLPDYLAGVIDPLWTWGGFMTKRSRLWFQALAQKTDGTNVLAGIFSLVVSPQMLGESASGLAMEAQNSYGLTPSSGATGAGLLIDNPTPNYDAYYSVWSNGASTGGIDYNDNSPWQNWEPAIETDLIYLGSVLEKKSLGQMEFLLDRPMATGDQLRMSWRSSLTDTYSTPVVFTSTTIPIPTDVGAQSATNLDKKQYVQFLIEFKSASSGTSFLPIREMRVHLI